MVEGPTIEVFKLGLLGIPIGIPTKRYDYSLDRRDSPQILMQRRSFSACGRETEVIIMVHLKKAPSRSSVRITKCFTINTPPSAGVTKKHVAPSSDYPKGKKRLVEKALEVDELHRAQDMVAFEEGFGDRITKEMDVLKVKSEKKDDEFEATCYVLVKEILEDYQGQLRSLKLKRRILRGQVPSVYKHSPLVLPLGGYDMECETTIAGVSRAELAAQLNGDEVVEDDGVRGSSGVRDFDGLQWCDGEGDAVEWCVMVRLGGGGRGLLWRPADGAAEVVGDDGDGVDGGAGW
ncbi:hypothetical protein F0562_010671 [Nyssa sinensis]|uniref:Uncharacterized protein n=1 Tax=Nyssa sinensis TaxID=561372 RepID=A0A5J5A2M8_9ASTE|nr:hypothetical protein F0562_010671 [Nyssa sinensis]